MAAFRAARVRARPHVERHWRGLILFYGAALVLFAVHGLFHLWQWLWWPPPDTLQALYGPSELGRYVHAVTEAIVALALVAALWRGLTPR